MIRALFITGTLAAALHILGLPAQAHLQAFLAALPVLCMGLWVLLMARPPLRLPVGVGYLLMALSEFLDAWPAGDLYISLMVCLLAGYLLIVVGLTRSDPVPRLFRAAPFALWAVIYGVWILPVVGERAGWEFAFIVSSCVLMWRASARWEVRGGGLVLLGALMLGLSDGLLWATHEFRHPVPGARWLLPLTSLAGQVLMALGVVVATDRQEEQVPHVVASHQV